MNIKLLMMDVDGVLTDGKIIYTTAGEEIKSFHVRDGLGIKLAKKCGVHIAIISSRFSRTTEIWAKEVEIDYIFKEHTDKLTVYEDLKKRLNILDENISYIGDDLDDIPLLKRVGLPAVVADASEIVKKFAQIVTPQSGGNGAVRHLIEIILKRQNRWEEILESYTI